MEQRGRPATSLAPLDDLRSLVGWPGPFLSVYLDLTPPTEDLAEVTRLRWRELREAAEAQGAPREVLDKAEAVTTDAHRQGRGLCVVATAASDPFVRHLLDPPGQNQVSWGPAPVLAPLIAERQWLQPVVVVLADRQGADITVYAAGDLEPTTSQSVQGRTHPIRKVQPGGWSQRRYQQRAEETWHHNMTLAAEEVTARARQIGARIVALGGDERSVGLLHEALPEEVRHLIRPIEVTRAEDGSSAHLVEAVRTVLRDWAADQLSHTLETYEEELGQDDRATTDAAATLAALRSSRVALLLLDLDGDQRRQAWMGSTADQVAVSPEHLPGTAPARPVELGDAAVAAALATGAEVQVLSADSSGPRHGIGALLRW